MASTKSDSGLIPALEMASVSMQACQPARSMSKLCSSELVLRLVRKVERTPAACASVVLSRIFFRMFLLRALTTLRKFVSPSSCSENP
jgi:hypothetical protein